MKSVKVMDLGSKVGYLTTLISSTNQESMPEIAKIRGVMNNSENTPPGSIRLKLEILSGPRTGRVFSSLADKDQMVSVWSRRCPELDLHFDKQISMFKNGK